MSQPSQNTTKKEYSSLDQGQILKDVHVPEANALKVINSNCLVPEEFTKVTIDYVTAGNGIGEIEKAYYWNSGILQESMAVVRGDQQPVSEITLLLFHSGLNPAFLSQKAFRIYDSVGSVGIFYALDGDTTVPSLGTNRTIKVDILSSDDIQTIASKTEVTLNGDSEFVASYSQGRVVITSVTTGVKLNAEDIDSTIIIQVTQEGVEDQSLFGKYFWIYTPTEKKHVWYSNGTTPDPNPATTTGGIEIVIVDNESRDNVLVKTANQINEKSTDFYSHLRCKQLLIRSNRPGITSEIEDGNTGFMFFTNLFGEAQRIIRTVELTYDINNNITEAISY
jgi:hypothetical protein